MGVLLIPPYMVLLCVFYQHLRRLRVIYYLIFVSIIITVSQWLMQLDFVGYVVGFGNYLAIAFEFIILFVGIIYQFVYLKIRVVNQAQLDELFKMPMLALFPRPALWFTMKKDYDLFWDNYNKQR